MHKRFTLTNNILCMIVAYYVGQIMTPWPAIVPYTGYKVISEEDIPFMTANSWIKQRKCSTEIGLWIEEKNMLDRYFRQPVRTLYFSPHNRVFLCNNLFVGDNCINFLRNPPLAPKVTTKGIEIPTWCICIICERDPLVWLVRKYPHWQSVLS